MRFSFRTSRRRLRLLAAGLAIAALAAPAAQADNWWEPAGGQPASASAPSQVSTPSEGWQYSHDGPRSGPVTMQPAFPIDSPRSGPVTVDLPAGAPVSGPSFDWGDAGIGVAIGLGVGLVLAAAVLLVGRRRSHLAGA